MTPFGAKSQAQLHSRIEANWIIARALSAILWEQVATRRK